MRIHSVLLNNPQNEWKKIYIYWVTCFHIIVRKLDINRKYQKFKNLPFNYVGYQFVFWDKKSPKGNIKKIKIKTYVYIYI
jgi:hypothetical protein